MPRGVYDRAAAKAKREKTVVDSDLQESFDDIDQLLEQTQSKNPRQAIAAQKGTRVTATTVDDGVRGMIKPSDLRMWDEKVPLYVRNNSLFAITHDDKRGGELSLKHKGSGEESAVLPLEVARHPGFQKIWRRGMVSVSDDPAMEHELLLMELREEELRKQKLAEVLGVMETNPAEKDIVESKCVHCGDRIFIPASQTKRNDIPPLCADHLDMAPIFTIERYRDAATGEEATRWISMTMQPVMREQKIS